MITDGPIDTVSYEKSDEIIREFRHLVYAFDPNLPLNTELNEQSLQLFTPYMGIDAHERSVSRIRGFMEFFIHYIDTYKVSKSNSNQTEST
jgi:hypothetical protein